MAFTPNLKVLSAESPKFGWRETLLATSRARAELKVKKIKGKGKG
jgi:hypothetical protein